MPTASATASMPNEKTCQGISMPSSERNTVFAK
jgi:hypothetical protein